MADCKHKEPPQFAPDEVIANLPESQGTIGRHRCVVCAYNAGQAVARGAVYEEKFSRCAHGSIAPVAMIEELPVYQGGPGRHRCVQCAYNEGLRSVQVDDLAASYAAGCEHVGPVEAIAQQKVRIGQRIFRANLLNLWENRCALTGIEDPSLLRASHIVPWSRCETDQDKLNKFNGILLSPLWDAAFDRGFVSFENNGSPIYSGQMSERTRFLLESSVATPAKIDPLSFGYLDWNRNNWFQS